MSHSQYLGNHIPTGNHPSVPIPRESSRPLNIYEPSTYPNTLGKLVSNVQYLGNHSCDMFLNIGNYPSVPIPRKPSLVPMLSKPSCLCSKPREHPVSHVFNVFDRTKENKLFCFEEGAEFFARSSRIILKWVGNTGAHRCRLRTSLYPGSYLDVQIPRLF